jgi:hypothetical protein
MSRFKIHILVAGLLAACWSAFPGDARGDEPSSDQAVKHLALVHELGDPDFQVRESASARLIELGSAVHPALVQGEHHPDPEIRFRCKRILALIEYESRERRYQEFLTGSTAGKPLGGWERFQRVVGDSEQTRRLFVEMHRAEWDVLEATANDLKLVHEKFVQRCGYLRQSSQTFRQQLPLGSIVTVIFLASEEDLRLGDVASSTVYTFCYQDSFRTAIEAGPNKAPLRTLLGEWVASNTGISTAYQGLMLAMRHDLKQGLAAAKKVLAEPAMPHHYKQFAMLALAKLGTKEDVPLLEKFMDDASPCGAMTVPKGNERVMLQTQLRDVALATVIHLSGEEVKGFGFTHAQKNTQMLFNVNTLGFEDDQQRDASRQKWEKFCAAGPEADAGTQTAEPATEP